MKKVFRKVLCCILSLLLITGTGISIFAAEETEVTPVIVVNDIFSNPIYNKNDGTVVFNFSDFQVDILFTSGFSSEILNLFSEDVIASIGEMSTLDIIMLLVDYLGYGGDINTIINVAIEKLAPILGSMDFSNIDIASIISSIDFKQVVEDIKADLQTSIDNMKKIRMNEDGTSADDSIGAMEFNESLEYYYDEDSELAYALAGDIGESIAEEVGYENTYVFTYDWRLDPVVNAELMSEFVEHVKSETGAEKVSVISEGYGSTVATTYLAINEDASDSIKNFVTVSSEFLGTSLVGDFFKREIVNEFSNLTSFSSAYIRYTNDISDNPITAFTTWLINYILNNEWEIQAFCLKIEEVLSDVEFFLGMSGVTAEIAKMPGIWALVPTQDYDASVEVLFGEEPSGVLFETVDAFKDYQFDYETILLDAKDSGINISVVASWDMQILPIGENHSVQSDGIVDTAYASFGAECVDLNEVHKAAGAVQFNEDGHDHISSNYDMLTPWYTAGTICHYIDASTCALPENTWFIKSMKHGTFSYESNSMEFLLWLVTADGERTVWQDVGYKQFMHYNRFINPGILNSDGVVTGPVEPGKYLLGDINLDGIVTSYDAYLALRIASGKEYIEEGTIPFMNGDVYADGVINDADARKILLMSTGLIDYMQSGISFEYITEQGTLENAGYDIDLRPLYNPVTNNVELQFVLLDAKDATNGNFIINFNTEMFSFADSDVATLENGYVVAGAPVNTEGVLTVGFAAPDGIRKNDCDENGDVVLAVLYLQVSRKEIIPTTIDAGASFFNEDDENVFVSPVEFALDEDFFFMLGDADNNRYISAADARIALRIAARIELPKDEMMLKRCDVDFDGKITAKDARLILRASAKLITSFTEEA